jgi:hypothetical protein
MTLQRFTSRRTAATLTASVCLACLLATAPTAAAATRVTGPTGRHVAGLGFCGSPAWVVDGDQPDCRLGPVAPAGDVNHDGYADVLVAAYNYDHPEVDEGAVFLYLGGPEGVALTPAWIGESNQTGARLGDKLSGAGDVNGDGYDDVVVGAAQYDSIYTDGGAAFLYLGSATGLRSEPSWIAVGDQENEQFGLCVQGAGDVNGDGYGDVIVGAWLASHGEPLEGRAFVYFGSDSGLADQPGWSGESDFEGAAYGYYCASAGDVNHDGYDDIAVGARRFSGNGLAEEGRSYVYYGGPTGPSLAPDWAYDAGRAKSEVGENTISAGDVNADGFGDLLVGAFRWDLPALDSGKAMLFLGSASGLASAPAWEVEGAVPRDNFGYHLDGAGDVNGDGFDDVVVSAPGADTDNFAHYNAGQVTLWLGSAHGLATTPAWRFDGDQAYQTIEVVRGVGDVNGDGLDDFAVGCLYHDSVYVDDGRAWVFYGRSQVATAVVPGATATAALSLTGANPASGFTAFSFSLAEPGWVRLAVYDLTGRTVSTLVDGVERSGAHRVGWHGRSGSGAVLPAGVYLVRLETPGGAGSVKVALRR